MTLVIVITMSAFHTTKKRSLFVGILCILFNIGMYASPLTIMVCTYIYIPSKFIVIRNISKLIFPSLSYGRLLLE